jgi:hypothetical protein
MTNTNAYLPDSHGVFLPPRGIVDAPEQQRAKARLQKYLALLDCDERERAHLAEQVIRRALSRGNPDGLMRDLLLELHRALAVQVQARDNNDADVLVVWRPIDWWAVAWMRSSSNTKQWALKDGRKNGSTRLASMPPIERRPMVPDEIEYISWRGIRRSFVAWLLGKRAPAELSLGRIPGK